MAYINSTINKRYIVRAKLHELLKRLFGDDYTLKVRQPLDRCLIEVSNLTCEQERGDEFSLAASRKLTDVSSYWAVPGCRETHSASMQEEIASVSSTE